MLTVGMRLFKEIPANRPISTLNSEWWRIPGRRRVMVSSCMLVGGCSVRFLMHTPSCTFDRRRFGLRMTEMLLALSDSCVFPLRLHASISPDVILCGWLGSKHQLSNYLTHASMPRTNDWLFSLMNACCLGLRPSAAMTDGWFPSVHVASSAGHCNAFFEYHDRAFLLGDRWRRLPWACVRLSSLWRGQPSAAAPEARWTICWAGWLSWELLRLTLSLAIWCQGWNASSVGESAQVVWSAPIENQGLCTSQEDGNDNGSVYLALCGEAGRVTLQYSPL